MPQTDAPFWRWDAVDITRAVRLGAVSAREVAEDALARQAAANPAINAVVLTLEREALEAADAVDAARARGGCPLRRGTDLGRGRYRPRPLFRPAYQPGRPAGARGGRRRSGGAPPAAARARHPCHRQALRAQPAGGWQRSLRAQQAPQQQPRWQGCRGPGVRQ